MNNEELAKIITEAVEDRIEFEKKKRYIERRRKEINEELDNLSGELSELEGDELYCIPPWQTKLLNSIKKLSEEEL